jgi:hypothetical protein
MVRSRRMGSARKVIRLRFMGNAYTENLKGRDHFGDLGVDGRIILNSILKKYLAQGGVQWRARLKTVVILRVPQKVVNLLIS